jgi:hypothetical protein
MNRTVKTSPRRILLPGLATFFLGLIVMQPVRADSISFQLQAAAVSVDSGGTASFSGTVSNGSGKDLHASDFFFNFSGFDPASVSPVQILGVSTDFLIPNASTSKISELFEVMLGTVPANSSFLLSVQLEDSAGDLSAIQNVTISVPGSVVGAAEPRASSFLGIGLMVLVLARKRFA